MSEVMYRYRNKHNGDTLTIVNAPMMADALYCYAAPWTEDKDGNTVAPTTWRLTFGMPDRDGMYMHPQHWTRIA